MLERQALRRATSAVGLLFKGRAPETRIYLGSCFSIVDPTVFLTAAHCVDGVSLDDLWLNHHGGPPPDLFTRARSIDALPESDLAIIRTEDPPVTWPRHSRWCGFGQTWARRFQPSGFPRHDWGSPFARDTALLQGSSSFLWHALARPDLQDLLDRFVPDMELPVLILGGLGFSILNAAVEEIAYRGIVLDALREVGLPLAVVIGLQAAAFGTIHFAGFPRGWSGVVLATVFGTVLGAIRIQAGGMLAPWIAHVLTDMVIVTVVLSIA